MSAKTLAQYIEKAREDDLVSASAIAAMLFEDNLTMEELEALNTELTNTELGASTYKGTMPRVFAALIATRILLEAHPPKHVVIEV